MLARAGAIRDRLPQQLAPLEVAAGIGLISVISFRYDVCDIDFYTAPVGVAVAAPAFSTWCRAWPMTICTLMCCRCR